MRWPFTKAVDSETLRLLRSHLGGEWFIIGNGRHDPAFDGIFSLFDSFLVSPSMCDATWKFGDSYNKDVISAIPLDNH